MKHANGKIYCNFCHTEIDERANRVRIPWPQVVGKAPKPDAHFHNRDTSDCWARVKQEAKARKEAAKQSVKDDLLRPFAPWPVWPGTSAKKGAS